LPPFGGTGATNRYTLPKVRATQARNFGKVDYSDYQ